MVTDLLLESFDDIFDVSYTARMEEELDEIEDGKLDWREAMARVLRALREGSRSMPRRNMTDIKRMEKPTDLICEKCGKPHGDQVGTPRQASSPAPDIRSAPTRANCQSIWQTPKGDLTEQDDEEYCENCGRPMVLKKGRFGQFYACSGYPDCKTTKQIGGTQKKADVPLEEKCPNAAASWCSEDRALRRVHGLQQLSELQVRQAEDHRREVPELLAKAKSWSGVPSAARLSSAATAIRIATSWRGASRFAEKCPECGGPYLIEKWLKAGPVAQCPNAECKYKRALPQPEPVAAS